MCNNKVLLHKHKRHTARRVASARYADLSGGEGTPSQVWVPHPMSSGVGGGDPITGPGGTPSHVRRVPIPGLGDTPSQVWGWGVPHPWARGHPIPCPRGYPNPVPGGYPIRGSGVPHLRSRGTWGTTPSSRPGWGTPPGPEMGYPPSSRTAQGSPQTWSGYPPHLRPEMGRPPPPPANANRLKILLSPILRMRAVTK